jgi:hypothetical protein
VDGNDPHFLSKFSLAVPVTFFFVACIYLFCNTLSSIQSIGFLDFYRNVQDPIRIRNFSVWNSNLSRMGEFRGSSSCLQGDIWIVPKNSIKLFSFMPYSFHLPFRIAI